jgi:Trk K+ transport system NAD-binding subunit
LKRSSKRLLLLLAALPVLVVVLGLLYQLGMWQLEGKPRGFWDSLSWASGTLTTVGYGPDSRWQHPAMVLYVMGIEFVGVFLIYLIVPIYLIPFLEERFETRLPQDAARDLSGHAVIYRYGPAVETLLAELAAAKVPTLVLEPEEGRARRLFEQGQRLLFRGLADGGLQAARLDRARALIANGSDDENATLILAARQLGFGGTILALVEEPLHRRPMMLAGANAVFTPRHILGAALAARASSHISPRVAGIQQLGRNLEIAEVRVQPQSLIAGQTLAAAEIGPRTGAMVIGQWIGGELMAHANAAERIEPDGILVVAGSRRSIERLTELAGGGAPPRRKGHFVVGGFGEVGRKVVELLLTVGEEVKVIDRQAGEGVDFAGNVLDARVLEAAGVRQAQAVVLALDTDSATLFATVILKDLVPEVPVIARVNNAENVERIHRAGAYFALSISQISGQMLAKKLLGEEAFAVDPQLKVRKVAGEHLAGQHPAGLRIRERTGCSVVAVERGDEVLVDLGPGFHFAAADTIYVCGSSRAVRRFSELFLPAV